jgi:hypothetical protein
MRCGGRQIRARGVTAGFEGVPHRYGVYQLFARFGHIEAYVWAFFGRARPTAGQLAAANAERASAQLRKARRGPPPQPTWRLRLADALGGSPEEVVMSPEGGRTSEGRVRPAGIEPATSRSGGARSIP